MIEIRVDFYVHKIESIRTFWGPKGNTLEINGIHYSTYRTAGAAQEGR